MIHTGEPSFFSSVPITECPAPMTLKGDIWDIQLERKTKNKKQNKTKKTSPTKSTLEPKFLFRTQ